mmetsp:Transcript_1703/g.3400  ORF Transcript_1703/g.3400 Transcript_1703/m.3400 type:complete len:122 (+) Transcript_1703:409-774(+)|eukprot:CAMPEP_0168168426 /NCGR_PEP_ID=MMETSP0139_2-20121125/3087_1 /TAXON_ID=44445 /ORGANISM="Pseudo-nitzschia australis, Strain 10249 10 AB" /LENGTH=121 /DNA_ID=CAMNT_0008085755 /DNA_START=464 /DNA_END=829 /DNA_ORIENTATION=-
MAGGSIWDEELKKFAAYKELSKHPNVDKFPKHIIGTINSAATDPFMPDTYTGDAATPTQNGIIVDYANGSHMQATVTNVLVIPELPKSARGGHKFKDIHLPLISVTKLCQAGCKVQFSKTC